MSRQCLVIEVRVVCGAQDAEPAGGDHLQEAKLSGSGKKTWVGTDGRSMVPTRYEYFLAFLKKGVWRSCAAVGLKRECAVNVQQMRAELLEGTDRTDGSFTRQCSTISLNAREYLCTPPSRSRIGGAPCTLSTDGNQIEIGNVEACPPPPFDGTWPKCSGRGAIGFRAARLTTHICKSTVREDSRDRGARPCASSRAVIPKDQISALESY